MEPKNKTIFTPFVVKTASIIWVFSIEQTECLRCLVYLATPYIKKWTSPIGHTVGNL